MPKLQPPAKPANDYERLKEGALADLQSDLVIAERMESMAEIRIDSKAAAKWVVGKYAELRSRRELYARRYKEMRESLKKEYELALESLENDERLHNERCYSELIEWTRYNLPAKKKSIDLLTGEVGFEKKRSRAEITDKEAALAWCEDHLQDAIKYDPRISRTAIKQWIEGAGQGEIPPGVDYHAGGDDGFFIR